MQADASGPIDLSKGPVSIALDGRKIALGFVVLVGLTVVFAYAFLSRSVSSFIHVVSLVGGVLSLLGVLVATPQYIRLYLKKLPGLTLTSEGFINYLVSPTLVPWTDVVDCTLTNLGTRLTPTRTLIVGLKPGALDHLVMPRIMRMAYFHASIFFLGMNLDFSLDELAEIFQRYSNATAPGGGR
jgi:hypothetical protein